MHYLAAFFFVALWSVAGAAELPDEMRDLCLRAEKLPFVGTTAPRVSADPLFQTLAATNEPAVLARVLDGADLDEQRGTTGMTALSFASASGNVKAVRLLLERGAQIDLPGTKSGPPIEYALTNGRPGMACLLLQWGAALPPPSRTPYLLPAVALAEGFEGAAALVGYLAGRGYDINATMMGDTALHIAAELGNTQLVRRLLKLGARTDLKNHQKETAEVVAVRSRHSEIAQLIRRARQESRLRKIGQ